MKVLHLSSEKSWRGGEQQIAYLIQESIKHQVEIFVCCRKNSPFEDFCQKNQIQHISLSFGQDFDLLTAWKIKQYAIEKKIDIVHMHSARSHSMGVLAHRMGMPAKLVLSKRTDFPVKSNWFSIYKYNYPAIARILCVSGKIKEIITPAIVRKEIVETVYSGVDLSRIQKSMQTGFLRAKYKLSKDIVLIGNTSALSEQKDPKTFVNVARMCVEQGLPAHFFLIGDGDMRDELQAYVESLGLEGRIHFTGFLKNIQQVLPELDIFFMPSRTEGLGTALLDAMSAEVPIVATRAGGIPEIVVEGRSGFIAEVGDISELSRKLSLLVKDSALRLKTAQSAKDFVKNFSKEVTALKTFKIYNELK
ncbi:MAG: glycosyltransferase family 4 protein [Bacteriovoracaceae bacterium]|nr:glycosyltransferase family 4 protein [Bacteriovoracaceae bacterium]